ncbi:MAG: adenylate/guanylate cyclase domain-containing protein [Bacteroidota bacterium]
MNIQLRYRFRHILGTAVAWTLAISLFALVRLYGVEEEGIYQMVGTQKESNFHILSLGLGMGGILGLIFGFLDSYKPLLRKISYAWIVLIRTVVHISITLLMVIGYIVWFHSFEAGNLDKNWLQILQESPYQKTALVFVIYTGVVSMLFNLFRQISSMFGPGIMYKLIIGKYHRPKEEERIFMFLDLRSSTTYAERLGHILYSELIQDCFSDLTAAIDQHQVEIYQYVGDEAVLTWPISDGLKDLNCIEAFFTFDQSIQSRAKYYFNKYDLVPAFKAGVNLGLVMVAEVGIVKKEIAYHSDVLNTAARIQGKCNEYGKGLLISEAMSLRIPPQHNYILEEVGTVSLKGKEQLITIFSVEKKEKLEHQYEFSE